MRIALAGIAVLLLAGSAAAQITMQFSGDIIVPREAVHQGTAVTMNGRIPAAVVLTANAVAGAALLGVPAFSPGIGWFAILAAVTWGLGTAILLLFRRVRGQPPAPPATTPPPPAAPAWSTPRNGRQASGARLIAAMSLAAPRVSLRPFS